MNNWIYYQGSFFLKDWCCFVGSLLFVIWLPRQTSLTPSTFVRNLGSLNGERIAEEMKMERGRGREGGSKLTLALGCHNNYKLPWSLLLRTIFITFRSSLLHATPFNVLS